MGDGVIFNIGKQLKSARESCEGKKAQMQPTMKLII